MASSLAMQTRIAGYFSMAPVGCIEKRYKSRLIHHVSAKADPMPVEFRRGYSSKNN
jgi:hypothetical protein